MSTYISTHAVLDRALSITEKIWTRSEVGVFEKTFRLMYNFIVTVVLGFDYNFIVTVVLYLIM